ncbi:hypothetical protein Tco_0950798, partial [Tanacetum coccineum]
LLFELVVFTTAQVGSDWTTLNFNDISYLDIAIIMTSNCLIAYHRESFSLFEAEIVSKFTDKDITANPLPQMFINTMHIRPLSSGGTIVAATDLVKESGDMNSFMCFLDSVKLKRKGMLLLAMASVLVLEIRKHATLSEFLAAGKYAVGSSKEADEDKTGSPSDKEKKEVSSHSILPPTYIQAYIMHGSESD